jgi:hypothetical protein
MPWAGDTTFAPMGMNLSRGAGNVQHLILLIVASAPWVQITESPPLGGLESYGREGGLSNP